MDRSPPSRGSIRESGAPFMNRSELTNLGNWRINLSKVAFAGALVGACAVGVAAEANADPGNCDPFYLSMTPQPRAVVYGYRSGSTGRRGAHARARQ